MSGKRPELRAFNTDVIETIRVQRGRLVAAALTILRAWHVAREKERLSLSPFGSFEQWSRRVREPLVWLGCADPVETLEELRADDPMRAARAAVFAAWREVLTLGQWYLVADLVSRAQTWPQLYEALHVVAAPAVCSRACAVRAHGSTIYCHCSPAVCSRACAVRGVLGWKTVETLITVIER